MAHVVVEDLGIPAIYGGRLRVGRVGDHHGVVATLDEPFTLVREAARVGRATLTIEQHVPVDPALRAVVQVAKDDVAIVLAFRPALVREEVRRVEHLRGRRMTLW